MYTMLLMWYRRSPWKKMSIKIKLLKEKLLTIGDKSKIMDLIRSFVINVKLY